MFARKPISASYHVVSSTSLFFRYVVVVVDLFCFVLHALLHCAIPHPYPYRDPLMAVLHVFEAREPASFARLAHHCLWPLVALFPTAADNTSSHLNPTPLATTAKATAAKATTATTIHTSRCRTIIIGNKCDN